MKLIKSRRKTEVDYICEDISTDYIKPCWFHIKDEQNQDLGTLTGYTFNIPLIINDLLTKKESLLEFDSISHLCMCLWDVLEKQVDPLKDQVGDLYFLNNLYLEEYDETIEKDILALLKDKYEMIVYSLGQVELFDTNDITRPEGYFTSRKDMLLDMGWENNNPYGFFVYRGATIEQQPASRQDEEIEEVGYATPVEDWVIRKGLKWLQSLWDGIIKQSSFSEHFERITNLQDTGMDGVHFLKILKVKDYKQFDPLDDYIGEAPVYAPILRSEALYITYKRKKYMISFSQDIWDGNMVENISIGRYDELFKGYVFGQGFFDLDATGWMDEIISDLFNRIYLQYKAESQSMNNQESLFALALKGPVLIHNNQPKK
ncbi:hypothetical protein [Niallia sp. Krafla_26]|uniref:hypothetical protein n=1 Tax=Niallia sp. Krafla_26 TaxID=3064703 RepID=UPI003D168BB9